MARLFEWDPDKDALNEAVRDLPFEVAAKVFTDPSAVISQSRPDPYGGARWKITGRVGELLLTVIYTERGARTRIISARRAGVRERRNYAGRDLRS